MANSRVLLVINASDVNYANKLFKEIDIHNFFDIAYGEKGLNTPVYYISTVTFSLNVDTLIQNNLSLFEKVVGYTGAINMDPILEELGVVRIV